MEGSFLGGPSCSDPICLLGSVPRAAAALETRKVVSALRELTA